MPTLQVCSSAGSTAGALVRGTPNPPFSIYGSVLAPDALVVHSLATRAAGTAQKSIVWLAGISLGPPVDSQAWLLDAASVQGFAATKELTANAS